MELKNCDTSKPYVFVSYSHDNSERVHKDVAELQARGVNLWIDKSDMVIGKDVKQTNGIIRDENCKGAIFYLCEKSAFSEYCLAELRTAKRYTGKIIPVQCFSMDGGIEKAIMQLQRREKDDAKVAISDNLINEIIKPDGSEFISYPIEDVGHIARILSALEDTKVINSEPVVAVPTPKTPAQAPIETPSKPTAVDSSDNARVFTLFGKQYSVPKLKDFMVQSTEIILSAEPSKLGTALEQSAYLSDTNPPVGKTLTYFGSTSEIVINGVTVYVGTSFGTSGAVSQIKKLLEIVGRNKDDLLFSTSSTDDVNTVETSVPSATSGSLSATVLNQTVRFDSWSDGYYQIVKRLIENANNPALLANIRQSILTTDKSQTGENGRGQLMQVRPIEFKGVTYYLGLHSSTADKKRIIKQFIETLGYADADVVYDE
jgi:hypothetical protein